MNRTPSTAVAFVSTVAPARAPNAVWLPPPPNALAMSPPLPCCSSTTRSRRKHDKHVDHGEQIVEHNARLYRARAAPRHYVEEPLDVEAGAADQRAVDVRQRHQVVDVVRLYAAAVDDVAMVRRRRRRTTAAPASGCARAPRPACCGVALRPVPIAQTGS